jgi:hypothetical protein
MTLGARSATWVGFARSPASFGTEVSGDVLVAGKPADVVEAGRVGHAGEEQLGEVVREDRVGLCAVDRLQLALGLPDGDELDADAGNGRRPLGQLPQWRVGGLVKHEEQSRAESIPRSARSIERLVHEIGDEPAQHWRETVLIGERRGEVERIGAVEEPVEVDVAVF